MDGATGWMLPVVTVFSFSRPLLRAEVKLDLCCFFSLEASDTAALMGFTG